MAEAGGSGTGERARAGAEAPAGPRRPQQERGRRRFDAILDAASAIIAEEGMPAATMHAIARRSGTTIGSMYHFFPDRDAVLLALAERHGERIGVLAAGLAAVDWSELTLEQTVERFVDALFDYAVAHPDLLPVSRAAETVRPTVTQDRGPERMLIDLAEAIVAHRTPGLAPATRAVRGAMMLALVEGVFIRGGRMGGAVTARLRRELKRAMVAYLGAVE